MLCNHIYIPVRNSKTGTWKTRYLVRQHGLVAKSLGSGATAPLLHRD